VITAPLGASTIQAGESVLDTLGVRCGRYRYGGASVLAGPTISGGWMRVELLGTVQVRDDARGLAHVGGPRARALLALLALEAGRVVPAEGLINRLWDGDPPEGARSALQSMISRLRGVLGEAIESHPAGYRLAVGRGEVDALAFEDLAGQGSRALAGGEPARAAVILRQALALWRGPALAGLPAAGPVAGIAARLEELRRSATADRIEADLAAAAAADAAGLTAELRTLVGEDPLAERPRALLMRALYLAGRQADAFAVYADAREQLAAQLGVDPSPQLEQVYLGVLRRSLPEASVPEARDVGRGRSVGKSESSTSAGPRADNDPAGPEPAAAPRTSLRVPLTSLVGRDDQVAQVEVLTGENRLVTLTGPGGVGKTRLAAEVAERVAARARGGVWLVDLAPLSDPGDVPYAVLTATGIRDRLLGGSRSGDPGQAAEPGVSSEADPSLRLVSGLRERSGLLVLDNCEHLIEAVAGLADAVLSGCHGIRVLAASREALGITGETVCPVPPLPVPPDSGDGELAAIMAAASVRLLADRARAVRPGFAVTGANAADVAGICRALDGMPLAIELAAARLRTMSPAQLTGRLDDRFAVLTGGSRTALPRHQTLRAVVEWSWDLLSKPERVLARRLAPLPGGATLAAAEQVCGDEPNTPGGELPAGAVLDVLTGLADKSFLTVDGEAGDIEPRYRMLDTIRAYCLERLAEADEEDGVRDRMSGYYLALAETAEPLLRTRAQRRWFDVLAAESDNMHAALRWAIEQGDADTALRFGAALTWYWHLCGQRANCAALSRAALALDAAGPRREDRAAVEARALCAGNVASADWNLEPAWEPVDAAAAAAAADHGGRPLHPLLVLIQVRGLRFGGEGERALHLLAGYLDCADPWTGAAARLQGAVIMSSLGRVQQASLDCDAALTGFRDLGEIWGIAMSLRMRAELDKVAGDYRGAIAALEEAVALDRQLANVSKDLTRLYAELAWLRVHAGDYAAAHAVLDLAGQNAWAQGDSAPYLRLIRAELAWQEGRLAEATRLCEDILREGADKPTSWAPLRALSGARLGVLALEAGDTARGTALLRDALDTAATVGDRPSTAAAVEGLAAAALRIAAAGRAAALLGAADSIRGAVDHSSLDAPGIRAAAKEQLGEAAFEAAYRRGLGLPYQEALGFAQASPAAASELLPTLLRPRGCGRRERRRLLGPHVGPPEHQVRDKTDGKRHKHAQVGERPGPGLAAQAERPEQITLPGQPARRRVGHQPPADRRGDHDGSHRGPPDIAVAPGRAEQLGLGVVAPAQRDVSQHDPAPGRDRHAERDQEALELADEVVREEHHVDGAQRHHRAVDRGSRVPGDPDAEGEQRQPGGVDVEHRAADQTQHGHDGEWYEEPGRQQCGERADGVGGYRRVQAAGRAGQQQAEQQQEDRRDGGGECGPADHAPARGPAREVPRVICRDVYPAQPEAGHGKYQRADYPLGRAAVDGGHDVPVDLVRHQSDEHHSEHPGHDRDPGLQPHDQVEAHHPAEDGQPHHQDQRDHLGTVAAAHAHPVKHGRGGQRGQDHQHGLPAHGQQPGDDRGQLVAIDPERGPAKHHCRRRAALARHGNEPAGQKRQHDPDDADDQRLPERDAEAELERTVAEAEHRDVRGEPRPEQVTRVPLTLALGDDVDAVHLDLERPHLRGAGGISQGRLP